MYRKFLNARSPLRLLERGLHGGLGPGNVGVVLAGHGVGKTSFLVCVALDELQELYVLLVKKHMLAPGSKHILNRLNTYASNLDIPLRVSIFMDSNYRCPPLGDHPISPHISPYLR